MISTPARRVLLIGWDAADWRVIDPLLAQGKMPHLAAFLQQGVRGNISTLYPPLSPMLWTSIATGKRPYKHGIHGFSEPTPDGRGVRPISNLARKTKAVWNILHQAGKTSNVIGWWPSHPAEPIRGVMVSNHYQRATAAIDKPWRMLPGTVSPARLAEPLAEFRFHPNELDPSHIEPFVPRFREVDLEKDRRLDSVARILAQTTSVHSAATALMQLEPWDFMAVYYDAIDHFGHGFMKYHPPRQSWIDERDFELYGGVIEAAYRFQDMLLSALLALAGEDTTVLLMSDHGFHPDEHRPDVIPVEPAGPAAEHRHFGIFAMKGPGIRAGETIHGASVLDICPTVLTLFGLPVGADMDGKVLANAFDPPPELHTIPSWDAVPGDAGCHPKDFQLDPIANAESIRQLVELGYIEPLPADSDLAVRQTVRELRFNLAQSYTDCFQFENAAGLLDTLCNEWPEEHRFGFLLADCSMHLGKIPQRREVLDRLELNMRAAQVSAREALAKYLDESGNVCLDHVPPAQHHEVRRIHSLAHPNFARLTYLRGVQDMLEGRVARAVDVLQRMSSDGPLPPALQIRLGTALLGLGRPAEAIPHFQAALKDEPQDVAALVGMARAHELLNDYPAMLEAALNAAQLVFFNPFAHALIGSALLHLEDFDRAESALRLALHQNPAQRAALRGLIHLYRDLRPDPPRLTAVQQSITARRRKIRERVAARQAQASASPPPTPSIQIPEASSAALADPASAITIVSGLPRSGTSMMMQMLAAGGIVPYSDGLRQSDSDNPNGYFEHESAARLASNNLWLPEARGQVVKIVAPLLPHLLLSEAYSVIMMYRDLDEVLASQRTMLDRLGRPGAALSDQALATALNRQMETVHHWLAAHPAVRLLPIRYRDILLAPHTAAARIAAFLNRPLDIEAMCRAVHPALQRHHGHTAPALNFRAAGE